jgi:formate hydrogenlyase subunit 5
VARDYSPVGPTLRGSGFDRDMRVIHPYVAYDRVPWKTSYKDGCDVLSRTLIRAEEFFESLSMVERCLDEMPEGPVLVEGFNYKPYAFALGYVEAPRGEDIHWSMLGDNQKIYRWRCRASSYNNWPPLRYMLRNNTISDAPLIVASIDPCYSCTERVTVVDVRKKKATIIPYKELERYSRERKDSPLKSF